jgi:hypothetical protein
MSRSNTPVAVDPRVRLDAVCHDAFAGAWEQIRETVGARLALALSSAAEAHRVATARATLDADAPSDVVERSKRLIAYRRGVGGDVLEPLIMALEASHPSRTVGARLKAAESTIIADVAGLPTAGDVAWTDDALDDVLTDSARRRFGKMLARVLRVGGSPGQMRAVPMRAIAAAHVSQDVMPGQCESARVTVLSWSTWMGEVEAAWARWSDVALPMLMVVEALTDRKLESQEQVEWETVREAAKDLQRALEALIERVPSGASSAEVSGRLAPARSALASDLGVAGTFLLKPAATPPLAASLRLARVVEAGVAWDMQVVARLRLHASLLAVLAGGNAVQGRLLGRLVEACVEPVTGISPIADQFQSLAREAQGLGQAHDWDSTLDGLRVRAEQTLVLALDLLPEPEALKAAINKGADAAVESLQAMVRQVPSALVVHSLESRPSIGSRAVETRSISLQEMARQAFDAMRMERIHGAASGVAGEVLWIRQAAMGLPDVLAFGFDAARSEFVKGEPEATGRAVGLVCEALARTADALGGMPAALEAGINGSRQDVAYEIAKGCESLFERAEARRMQAQLLAAQSRFAALVLWAGDSIRPYVFRASRWIRVRLSVAKRIAGVWAGRVKALLGQEPVAQAKSSRTIRTLADAKAEGAPLVYQRLFSSEPLLDPALMAGRDGALKEAFQRWERWLTDDGIPTVVVGRTGGGVTSFLNVFVERLRADEFTAVVVQLTHRVTEEAELAGILAAALGLNSAKTLDELAHSVLRAAVEEVPNAIAIDSLGHVYLRTPGGTDLLERLLTFMSETEPKVFWIGGISTSAWQVLRKAEPTAVAQVESLELSPLTVEQLQAAIMLRHRRSGLRLRFSEPAEGRRLLRRRLRGAQGTGPQQQLLAADYFDRLQKASLGTLRLALFQWLSAADFESGDGEVRMNPIPRPDFSMLDLLDLTQNFTLKAIMEHETLSMAEHDVVFRVPHQESYQVFESLSNQRLIESVTKKGGEITRSEVVEGLRYQVRPLLTGAVIAHLQRRNIIH